MDTKIHYDKQNAEAYLGMAIMAYSDALEIAIKTIADEKGVSDLSWFDELSADILRNAKGSITENISVDIEAPAMKFGVDTLTANLEKIRTRLLKNA